MDEPMTQNPTPEAPTDNSEGIKTWKQFGATLSASDGERHEFFPLQNIADGQTVELVVIGEPVFTAADFHGKFSKMEVDVRQGNLLYRLCVSGTRLAKALCAVEPGIGSTVAMTAQGPSGRERKWLVSKKQVILATSLRNHAA